MAVNERAWRQALQGRLQVDDHDAAFQRGQARHRAQALRNDVGVRRELVVRQRLVTGEAEDRDGARAEERKFFLQARGRRRVVRHQQDRARCLRGRARNLQGRGGPGQADPAQAGMFVRGQQGGLVDGHRIPAGKRRRSPAPGRGRDSQGTSTGLRPALGPARRPDAPASGGGGGNSSGSAQRRSVTACTTWSYSKKTILSA